MKRLISIAVLALAIVAQSVSVVSAAAPAGDNGHGAQVAALAHADYVNGRAHGAAVSAFAKTHGREVSAAAKARAAAAKAARAAAAAGNERQP